MTTAPVSRSEFSPTVTPTIIVASSEIQTFSSVVKTENIPLFFLKNPSHSKTQQFQI
ncbi:MAG: hypothetical protein ACYDBP_14840 [Leptospirales bacterium]